MNSSACGDSSTPRLCDVLVIGGGPGGSTVATLLAQQGRDVVVIEKAHHPRFHIGESLLPANLPLFEKLGVREQVERMGMRKWGVEFVSPHHAHTASVEFSEAWDKSLPYAWQVRRSELDELLFRNAASHGARTLEGYCVQHVAFDSEGAYVQVQLDDGAVQTWRTRYVIDASGRDTLLANQFKCKTKNPHHNSAALFGHFTGAQRLPGKQEGNITVMWFEHGWFWFIPLADGTTSVGAVCWPHYFKTRQQRSLPEFFRDTIALCPELTRRLQNAQLVDGAAHATGNYAYSSNHASGARYLMLGDAYAFIDPVFSSGVFLAMQGAFEAVPLVLATLDQPAQVAAARLRFEARLRHGPRQFSWFIYRVTNPTMREFFMAAQNPLRVKEALLSLLAGDIFGNTPIWRGVFTLKVLYYLVSLGHPRRTWTAWRQRRANIREVPAQ